MLSLNPHEVFMMHEPTYRLMYHKYITLGEAEMLHAQMGIGKSNYLTKFKNKTTEGFLYHIPIIGMSTRYGEACATGTEDIISMIAEANRTTEISKIVLEIDGPGGQASGTRELYMAVRKSKKPVVAYIKGMAASAHYYIGAAATEVITEGESSQIGSIGALAVLQQSKDEKTSTEIVRSRNSQNKALINSYEPITEQARESLVNHLTEMGDLFIADMKAVRPNIKDAALDGLVFSAKEAKKMGLIDGIMDKEQFLKHITKSI